MPTASDIDNSDILNVDANYIGDKEVLTGNPDDGWTFTPNADTNGLDTIAVVFTDGSETVNSSLTINVSSVNDKPISIGSEIQSKNALEDADPFFVFDNQIEFAPGPITAIDEQDQTLSYRFDFLETSQLGTFEINEEPISTEDTLTLDQVKAN